MKRLREEVSNQQDNEQGDSSCDDEPIPIHEPHLKKQLLNNESSSYLKLGINYFYGLDGVEQDYEKAFEFYLKGASEDGCTESMHRVGYCYDEGYGIDQDLSKAIEWYLKASEGGHAKAQLTIALCFQKGKGVEKDDKKAMEWYLKAADVDVLAPFYIGLLLGKGTGNEKDYSESMEWFLKAANAGVTMAQHCIAQAYDFGLGVPKDISKAFEWYMKAAENGEPKAQYEIGSFYETGDFVEIDLSKAFEWYMKAAENGEPNAKNALGVLFKYGKGVKKDFKKSYYWFTKAKNNADFEYIDIVDLTNFGIEQFKESDDVVDSNNELTSKVIIRFKEKDFEIGSNYLSSSKYLTTMLSENWRKFNQKEGDQIILDLTSIENEIFEQEKTDHIQLFEIYINYLLNNELPSDFKLELKLKLIDLSRYLGDDQIIVQIMKQSCLLTRYYILYKCERIQPIHNMIASCYLTTLPLDCTHLPEKELEILLNESELSSPAKKGLLEEFLNFFYKYPNSITFGKFTKKFTIIHCKR